MDFAVERVLVALSSDVPFRRMRCTAGRHDAYRPSRVRDPVLVGQAAMLRHPSSQYPIPSTMADLARR